MARGIPVRLVGAGYLLALALAVALAAFTIGAILSTALLVGPAATALRLTRSPGRANPRQPDRDPRNVAGDPARLRQLRLAAPPPRLAGELLRRQTDLARIHACGQCNGCAARDRTCGPTGAPTERGAMFSASMVHAWGRLDGGRVAGGRRLLRRPARVLVRRSCNPERLVRRRRRRKPDRRQHTARIGRFSLVRSARSACSAVAAATMSRQHSRSSTMLGLGALFVSLNVEYTHGGLQAPVRRDPRRQHKPVDPDRRTRRRLRGRCRASLPPAPALLCRRRTLPRGVVSRPEPASTSRFSPSSPSRRR